MDSNSQETKQDNAVKLQTLYYEDGAKHCEYYINQDEEKCGEFREFAPNGVIIQISNFEKNQLHGVFATYQDTGQIVSKMHFLHGKIDGVLQMYEKNVLVRQAEFFNGLILKDENFKNGKKINELNYIIDEDVESKLHGESTFYKDDQISIKMNYSKGKLDGKSVYYNEKYTVAIMLYVDGKLCGKSIFYHKNSDNVIKTVEYENDVENGKCMIFDLDGHVLEDAVFKEGKEVEKNLFIYQSGVLKEKQIFENEKLVNKVKMG